MNAPAVTDLPSALRHIAEALDQARDPRASTADLLARLRAPRAGLTALPARYVEVFDLLLDRLESSALFTEESCSFSRSELVDSLAQWLAKARDQAGLA
ncbi:MAG: hypothetical protein EBU07_01260 [Betaproteobacteria bacterium]|nr:hypothetical protein [Betaproteobacteria bacterium]NBS46557.1 hypothetical protein [Betaproteobacteria bacterium]